MHGILKGLILPPGGPLVIILGGTLLLLWHASRSGGQRRIDGHGQAPGRLVRAGLAAVGLGTLSLWALSAPALSTRFLRALEDPPQDGRMPVQPGADTLGAATAGPQAIVVLGADIARLAPDYGGPTVGPLSLERVRRAARLQRQTGLPLLVSGGTGPDAPVAVAVAMRRTLEEDFAVPVAWVEDRSADTAGNAAGSASLLRPLGIRRVLLVTHAWHMPRAATAFVRAGLAPLPAPTGFTAAAPWAIGTLLPTAGGLEKGFYAVHELSGLLFYRWRHGPPLLWQD